MKKIIVMFALGLFVTGGAFAQETTQKAKKQRTERTEVRKQKKVKAAKATPEEKATRHTETLSKKHNLTEDQKKQLHALNMRRVEELQALNEKYDKSDARNEAQRAERKAIQDRWQSDLRNILDEKQYAAYEADRKEKRENLEKKKENRKVKVQKRTKEVKQKRNS